MHSGNNSNNLGRNNKGRGWGGLGETKRIIEKGVTAVDEGRVFLGGGSQDELCEQFVQSYSHVFYLLSFTFSHLVLISKNPYVNCVFTHVQLLKIKP